MDSNKTAGEEARRQSHKNAASNLKQVLTATPHKTPTVRPPASYQNRCGSDNNEVVILITQSSSINGAYRPDCLVAYNGHSLWGGGSYPSAVMPSVYSTALTDPVVFPRLVFASRCFLLRPDTRLFQVLNGEIDTEENNFAIHITFFSRLLQTLLCLCIRRVS